MLTHYFELRAIPQIEMTEYEVINRLMQSLHHTLSCYQGEIGISFPCYAKQRRTLGGIIRLFGHEMQLNELYQDLTQEGNITNYAIILTINPIPQNVKKFLLVSRARAKGQSALTRAEKRLKAQNKWSSGVEQNMINKWGKVNLSYPHCHLTSKSTGQNFILWIKQDTTKKEKEGSFNSYGLSHQGATIPDF